MAVICKMSVPAETFALGRLLAVPEGVTIELETLVAHGDGSRPYLWILAPDVEKALATIRERTPTGLTTVEVVEDRALVALEWNVEEGDLFSGIASFDGHVLTVRADHEGWVFDVRFPEHAVLSRFGRYCEERGIEFTVERIYHATQPHVDADFGLTDRQREALVLAVRTGYYAVPRRCRTADLADRFGISEQAVLERLRRGIVNLVSTTLLPTEPDR